MRRASRRRVATKGLTLGTPATVYVDASSVLVKPEAARAQREADTENETERSRDETGDDAEPGPSDTPATGVEPKPRPSRRFFGTVQLDPLRTGRDMSVVADEVVQHFNALPGAEVEVSVEIAVTVRDGVSEAVRRIVDENCNTLRFRSHGFEEE